ncbi:MAG: response regulator [Bernardetiaceae bacterium]|nr:response regulator [Bernardetiaceae bacterium]
MPTTQIKKIDILLADDEPNIIQAVTSYFAQDANHDYNLLYAPNGEIACQLAWEKQPSLILLDWQMPVKDGMQTLKCLKSKAKTADIPVIIASGFNTDEDHLAEALGQGAVDFIRKPFSKVELLARVQAAVRLSEAYLSIKMQKAEIQDLANKMIAQKERELATTTLQIAQKSELLETLQQKIEDLPRSTLRKEILQDIKSSLSTDNHWEQFKMHFEEVHPNFFEKLKTAFPKLSQNELKLCVYIRMRLSNKEIAQLLNISPKGIETARYRLKKKFELAAEVDMNDFIQSL